MNTISKYACSAKIVLLVLTANKPITKQNLLASLIQEIENSPMIISRLHRAATRNDQGSRALRRYA